MMTQNSDSDAGTPWPAFTPARPVTVVGAGVMGTMVAWACVNAGLWTRLYEIDAGRAALARRQIEQWLGRPAEKLEICNSLQAAVSGAQLVFENVPENLALKSDVLGRIHAVADPETYIGSNTSSLRCAALAHASGRPERFFNMNFCDPRESSLTELMQCAETAPQTIRFAKAWGRHLGMVVLHVRKDQMGYSHNRLWRVIKKEVLRQIDQSIATPEDIDRGWMLSFESDIGPCGIMDAVGLGTILGVEESYFRDSGDEADRPPQILVQMVADGKLGVQSGEGFYTYPDPAYRKPGFLQPDAAGGSQGAPSD